MNETVLSSPGAEVSFMKLPGDLSLSLNEDMTIFTSSATPLTGDRKVEPEFPSSSAGHDDDNNECDASFVLPTIQFDGITVWSDDDNTENHPGNISKVQAKLDKKVVKHNLSSSRVSRKNTSSNLSGRSGQKNKTKQSHLNTSFLSLSRPGAMAMGNGASPVGVKCISLNNSLNSTFRTLSQLQASPNNSKYPNYSPIRIGSSPRKGGGGGHRARRTPGAGELNTSMQSNTSRHSILNMSNLLSRSARATGAGNRSPQANETLPTSLSVNLSSLSGDLMNDSVHSLNESTATTDTLRSTNVSVLKRLLNQSRTQLDESLVNAALPETVMSPDNRTDLNETNVSEDYLGGLDESCVQYMRQHQLLDY